VAYPYVETVIARKPHASAWMAKRPQVIPGSKPIRRGAVNGRSAATTSRQASQFDVAAKSKTIGILVFEGMAVADLMGPAEAFSRLTIPTDNGRDQPGYRVATIGISGEACATESGITVKPQVAVHHAPPLDTVIVPGGSGIHNPKVSSQIEKWLDDRATRTRRIATLGTGIYALAATGLLDGRRVVTHWRCAKDVASRFPKLRVNPSNLFVKDGSFYTCAGETSAIDLSLALIEEDYGRQLALSLARELVVHVKRPGGQEQYSEHLQFQVESSDRFADLPAWILSHLSNDLSVDALAERAGMSRRNFTRLFYKTFGKAPSQFVAEARMTEAQRRVLIPRNNLESIAASLGFKSADVFSKAFERHVGVRPRTYRARRRASAKKSLAKV
jgi:transcriptional regulator GlxA family with amidase domain